MFKCIGHFPNLMFAVKVVIMGQDNFSYVGTNVEYKGFDWSILTKNFLDANFLCDLFLARESIRNLKQNR